MAKKTVLIRVVEWTAYLPQTKDPASPLMMTHGTTGFEADENEKLLEVAVSGTGSGKYFTMEVDGEQRNIKHGLYAFQAVLATQTTEPLPEPKVPENPDAHAVVLPGQPTRSQRRNGGKQ